MLKQRILCSYVGDIRNILYLCHQILIIQQKRYEGNIAKERRS